MSPLHTVYLFLWSWHANCFGLVNFWVTLVKAVWLAAVLSALQDLQLTDCFCGQRHWTQSEWEVWKVFFCLWCHVRVTHCPRYCHMFSFGQLAKLCHCLGIATTQVHNFVGVALLKEHEGRGLFIFDVSVFRSFSRITDITFKFTILCIVYHIQHTAYGPRTMDYLS